MRKDHRPLSLFRLQDYLNDLYIKRCVLPQFEHVGRHAGFINPRFLYLTGPNISAGDHFLAIATKDGPIRLDVFCDAGQCGEINIGDYSILSPGAHLTSATSIRIGNGCMLAENCYLTDADWHDIYHRPFPPGETSPIVLDDNVWVAKNAIICKGVHVGENSIIGAGSVVVRDIPRDVIAAGNPAKPVKSLDPDRPRTTRQDAYITVVDWEKFSEQFIRKRFEGNTYLDFIRSTIFPNKKD